MNKFVEDLHTSKNAIYQILGLAVSEDFFYYIHLTEKKTSKPQGRAIVYSQASFEQTSDRTTKQCKTLNIKDLTQVV